MTSQKEMGITLAGQIESQGMMATVIWSLFLPVECRVLEPDQLCFSHGRSCSVSLVSTHLHHQLGKTMSEIEDLQSKI